jgi:hypothetical protein
LRRGFFVVIAVLAMFPVASAAWAEEFQAVPTARDALFNGYWNWANPKAWQNAAKKPGVPATAADVGVISPGHGMAVWPPPLGTPASRPTIRVEKGGIILLGQDLINPLILAGGTADGAWLGHSIAAPITVTADSTICNRDDFALQIRVDQPVTNTVPVTLHFSGGVEWHCNSSKTFTGAISLDRGAAYVTGPLGTGQFGTGPIHLAIGTKLVDWTPVGVLPGNITLFTLSNDLFGDGSIMAGNGAGAPPQCLLVVNGVTLHPGEPEKAGTLSIFGSAEFRRTAAGQPGKLIIDVEGDGSTLAADYGQLAIAGNLSNSLDNLDLVLRLKPGITAEQAARFHLTVLTAANGADMTKPNFHSFHSVLVTAGDRKGTAAVRLGIDALTDHGTVDVSDITLK